MIVALLYSFKAAQFGKCFITNIDSEEFVKMCRLLRVLNAARDRKIGIPLTFTEYPFTVLTTNCISSCYSTSLVTFPSHF